MHLVLPEKHVAFQLPGPYLPRRFPDQRRDLERRDDEGRGDWQVDEGGLPEARGERRAVRVPGEVGVPEGVGAERRGGGRG